MRIKVTLDGTNARIPINYQSILQGIIYNAFKDNDYGTFLHDTGYQIGNKKYKFFNFSNLFGNYRLEKNVLIFNSNIYFYISSESEQFIRMVYNHFFMNGSIRIYNQIIPIINLEILELEYFEGIQHVTIKTLSPVVAYRSLDNYTTYYKPYEKEFEKLCIENLIEKNNCLDNLIDTINFEIIDIHNVKKRVLKFKNTFYEAYLCELEVLVDFDTLLLIYNTGLSAKGSTGFGMIEVI